MTKTAKHGMCAACVQANAAFDRKEQLREARRMVAARDVEILADLDDGGPRPDPRGLKELADGRSLHYTWIRITELARRGLVEKWNDSNAPKGRRTMARITDDGLAVLRREKERALGWR